MKLYTEGSIIYYEDVDDYFWGSIHDVQFEDHTDGDVTIWFYQNRGREHKTFSQGRFPITDVLDKDGNAYGTTVNDIVAGLNTSITVRIKDGFDGLISAENSTSTPLTGGATFTGTTVDTLNYGMVIINIKSDQASAIDGLDVQFSSDNANWDHSDTFTILANTGKVFTFQTVARYLRVLYTNDATPQTFFRLQTILKPSYVKPSSHRIADTLSGQDDAELVKSILSGEDQDNIFQNVKTTRDGYLAVSDNSSGLSIATGTVQGQANVNKFGNAPDFDDTDNEVDIWDGANDAGIDQMVYQFSTTADIDSISSSDAGDTEDIEIQGLDANYDLVVQTITLTGQTRAALTTNLIRVFRMKNVGSNDLLGDVYCYVNTAISGGVPNDSTQVRSVILIGNNQTEMAIYTVPAGKTGYIREIYASTAGGSRATNYIIKLKIRPFGQVFQLKHRRAVNDDKDLEKVFDTPEKATEKADIIMTTQAEGNNIVGSSMSAGFDIILVDD